MNTNATLLMHTCAICGRKLNVKNSIAEEMENSGVFHVEVGVEPCPECVMRTDHYLKAVKSQAVNPESILSPVPQSIPKVYQDKFLGIGRKVRVKPPHPKAGMMGSIESVTTEGWNIRLVNDELIEDDDLSYVEMIDD